MLLSSAYRRVGLLNVRYFSSSQGKPKYNPYSKSTQEAGEEPMIEKKSAAQIKVEL
jgi:hypothetical protein